MILDENVNFSVPEGTQDNLDTHFVAATHSHMFRVWLPAGNHSAAWLPAVAFNAGPFSSAGLDRSHGWSCWWLELGREWENVVTLLSCQPQLEAVVGCLTYTKSHGWSWSSCTTGRVTSFIMLVGNCTIMATIARLSNHFPLTSYRRFQVNFTLIDTYTNNWHTESNKKIYVCINIDVEIDISNQSS